MTWAAPASNGGSAISTYTVTSNPSGFIGTSTGALNATVTGLANGTSYTFTVTATNAVGIGPASAASNTVVPATVPAAPGTPAAVGGNGQATVTWIPPASNGGSAITGYAVTSSPGNVTATTTGALNATVTGLTNGTNYSFTVTATNAVGIGPASVASNAVVPFFTDYEWAQWTVPPNSPPAGNFSVGTDTVTDLTTQLVWQRAPGGLNTWASAQTYCAGLSLGGLSGWRLPTLIELESIVDHSRSSPAIEPTVFPGTQVVYFWSGSTSGLFSNLVAQVVTFDSGASSSVAKTGSTPVQVRCVRCAAAPCTVPTAGPGAPPGRYTVATDTVLDTKTMLTWQRATAAMTYTWANAGTYCTSLSLSGTGWRLPTIKELQSLVDIRAAVSPPIDVVAFPGTQKNWFWSSSPFVSSTSDAWVVGFTGGSTWHINITANNQVRCVR